MRGKYEGPDALCALRAARALILARKHTPRLRNLQAKFVAKSGTYVLYIEQVGYLDFGVNAKRLNFVSIRLRAAGWDAPEITSKTHPSYFAQNSPR